MGIGLAVHGGRGEADLDTLLMQPGNTVMAGAWLKADIQDEVLTIPFDCRWYCHRSGYAEHSKAHRFPAQRFTACLWLCPV